ncbi:MAG: DUF3021 domain-containing protein [Oscillospiraceae bacterium]|nr:DUF3021 domain-containing protein [Oscillospiraceae bacterium]
MKKFLSIFVKRGLMMAGWGPLMLAFGYGMGNITSSSPQATCMGILTMLLLGFLIGGMSAVYCVERLPFLSAVLLHFGVPYIAALFIYLLNGWIPMQMERIFWFTVVAWTEMAVTWLITYHWNKRRIRKINRKLKERNSEA